MVGSCVWMSNPLVGGGSKIDLMCNDIKLVLNNYAEPKPVAGKPTTETYTNRLVEVDYQGHANPSYIVLGKYDSTSNTTKSGSVQINSYRLGSFMMVGSPSWFFDEYFVLNKPPGSILIVINGCTLHRNPQETEQGKWADYTLNITETKAWS